MILNVIVVRIYKKIDIYKRDQAIDDLIYDLIRKTSHGLNKADILRSKVHSIMIFSMNFIGHFNSVHYRWIVYNVIINIFNKQSFCNVIIYTV